MYIWGKDQAAGRVRLFVGNPGSGQRFPWSGPRNWSVDNSELTVCSSPRGKLG